jgi:hypothetical protein
MLTIHPLDYAMSLLNTRENLFYRKLPNWKEGDERRVLRSKMSADQYPKAPGLDGRGYLLSNSIFSE